MCNRGNLGCLHGGSFLAVSGQSAGSVSRRLVTAAQLGAGLTPTSTAENLSVLVICCCLIG